MNVKLENILENSEVLISKISEDMKEVIVKDEEAALRVAVNLLLFVNNVDALYKKVIKMQTGKVITKNLVYEIRSYVESDTFLKAYEKIKIYRNIIAHNVSFTTPVLNYFSADLKGMSHVCNINKRLFVILQTMREDAYYANVSSRNL